MIPYDHDDRLRAIVATYFAFLQEAGFEVAESSYDAAALVGRMLLRRPDVVLEACLHNDDLDFLVAPAVDDPTFVKVNQLVLYVKRATVDYAEFLRRRDAAPEPSQDQIWRDCAFDLADHLDRILAFAQADGYEERLADRDRYEAEVAAEFDRQIAEYGEG